MNPLTTTLYARWRSTASLLVPCVLATTGLGQTHVDLDNYPGVFPNDPGSDSRAGIQNAIDEALLHANGAPGVVHFERGATYYVSSLANTGSAVFLIDSQSGLTLEGHDAQLIQTSDLAHPASLGADLFFFDHCTDVEVRDLTVDVVPLPYVDCVVLDKTPTTVTGLWTRGIRSHSVLTQYPVHWGWQLAQDAPGLGKLGNLHSFSADEIVAYVGGSTQGSPDDPVFELTFYGNGETDSFEPGDRFTYHFRKGHNFRLSHCVRASLTRVTSFGAGLFFAAVQFGSDIALSECQVTIKPGRWRSTNGDGVHASSMSNLTIQDCLFHGLSDDAIHVKACQGFTITGNRFVGLRGNGVTLDGDGAINSQNGLIAGNSGFHLSGGLLRHYSGDYTSVVIRDNLQGSNHRMIHQNRTDLVRLVSKVDGTLAIGAELGGLGHPANGSDLILVPMADPSAVWDMSSCFNKGCCDPCSPHVVFTSTEARREGDWLAIGAESPNGPQPGTPVQVETTTMSSTFPVHVDDEYRFELVAVPGEPDTYRIRCLASAQDQFLTVNPFFPPTNGTLLDAGDAVTFRADWTGSTYADRQLWTVEVLDGQ